MVCVHTHTYIRAVIDQMCARVSHMGMLAFPDVRLGGETLRYAHGSTSRVQWLLLPVCAAHLDVGLYVKHAHTRT